MSIDRVTLAEHAVALAAAALDRRRSRPAVGDPPCIDLALSLAPDWKACGGYRFDGARVEMIATFVAGAACLTCGGNGQQSIGAPSFLGRYGVTQFTRVCPTCEGSGQR